MRVHSAIEPMTALQYFGGKSSLRKNSEAMVEINIQGMFKS
jgi:hypothetical protein